MGGRMQGTAWRLWLLVRVERGQSLVEYAIVTALIAVAALAALEGFGDGVKSAFDAIIEKLPK